MKSIKFVIVVMFAAVVAGVFSAGAANAGPCQIDTATATVCPANSICLKWAIPPTREVVANEPVAVLAPAEIKGYKIKLDSLTFPINNVTNFTYTVPANAIVPTTAVWSIATVDVDGRESTKPFTCTQPVAVAGPKSQPAAPGGLSITTGA